MTKLRHALSLSSSTYKKHVFEGFARFQQNDEFVDMTLAADGHWVKVHRTLVALSSPYFRELLRSIPSQHPVIYLTGVNNKALGYILEYIYSGEVEIPIGEVKSFLNTAQDLQIAGLKNTIPPDDNEITSQDLDTDHLLNNSRIQNEDNCTLQPEEPTIDLTLSRMENENNYCSSAIINETISLEETNGLRNINTPGKTINITLNEDASNDNNGQNPVAKIEILSNILINENSGQDQLPESYTEALVNLNNQDMSINNKTNISVDNYASFSQLSNDGNDVPMSEDISGSGLMDCDNIATQNKLIQIINLDNREQLRAVVQQDAVLYTVSNRGALQLILNHFMYYCHYQRENGRKRRWRCIDYRDAHCPASIDTVGEQIAERKNKHCHPNHDEKIRKKMIKSNVKYFPTIELAEAITKQQGCDEEDSVLYTLSNRGALQLILNHFMYYCHYQRENGRKRRWRCIDYRDTHCPASIDTVGEQIVERKNKHCHPNHDEKIRKKMIKSNVKYFPTIELAEAITKQQGCDEEGAH